MGRSRAVKLWSAVSVVSGLVMLIGSGVASADTITVANTNDSGAGSLRQAILDVMPGGTILLPSGSYTVASGELAITKSLTISGAGASSTSVSNAGSSRVFHTSGSGNTITISGVTISNGHPPTTMGVVSGGGVLNDAAKLTLSQDVIADNLADADAAATGGDGGIAQGGGVFNGGGGTLVVEDSQIIDNRATAVGAPNKAGGSVGGGGVDTGGTQTIERSIFGGNLADASGGAGATGGISDGGGLEVAAAGATSLVSTTFDDNLADASAGSGGSIGGIAEGGGAFMITNAPEMSATNVTFMDNVVESTAGGSAEAGGLSFGSNNPVITLTNATLSGNTASGPDAEGGDAALGGSNTVVENTIVSAGRGASGFENCAGTPRSLGHNLDSLDQCNFHSSGDQVDTDPLLGPLSDNGGPVPTMALKPGSPAIDAGANSGCPATDARGVTRPAGIACDIGAFEFATPAAKTLTASAITPGGAVLNGSASNPDILPASARFEYGLTTAYGSDTPPAEVGSAAANLPVTSAISGLAPNTLYHFRLAVTNASGVALGADQTFTTGSSAPAPPPGPKAPKISGLKLSPSSFVAASHGGAVTSVRTGATVSYSDTVPATTTFMIEHRTTGRLKGGSCVKATKRNRSRKHCTRLVESGRFTHGDRAGSNRFHFTGRVSGRKLARGRYLLVAVARNSAGAAPAVRAGFAVKTR
jgi:hypothetical protein